MFPVLKAISLQDEEVRRAWAAMRYGAWQTEKLLETWGPTAATSCQHTKAVVLRSMATLCVPWLAPMTAK